MEKQSYLNEECTKNVQDIYLLLEEALKKYNSLPHFMHDVKTDFQKSGGESLGYYLRNAPSCAYQFAKTFGIEVGPKIAQINKLEENGNVKI